MKSSSYQTRLFVSLGLVYFIWGSTYLGVKYGIQVLPPLLLTSMRFLIGGSVFFMFTLLRGYGIPSGKQLLGASKIGLLLSGIGTGGVAYSIQYIPSGIVALLVALLPFWTFVLDYLFFSHQRPSFLSAAGLVMGIAGIVFLMDPFASLGKTAIPLFPTLVVFASSISWALGSVISSSTPQPSPLQSTSIQMISGGIVALLLSLVTEEDQLGSLSRMNSTTWLALAYLIVFGSFVGYTAYVWLINNAPPLLTSTYAYVNPVVAMFLGWLFVREALSAQSLIASGIILAAVVLMTLGRKKSRAGEK